MLDPMLRPVADIDSKPFWDFCVRHELRLQRCEACGFIRNLPAPVCPSCGTSGGTWTLLSGRGAIYTYTEVHHTVFPGFKESLPYTVAWIDLAERRGLRILSLIVDSPAAEIRIGASVEVVFDAVAPDLTIPRFRVSRS